MCLEGMEGGVKLSRIGRGVGKLVLARISEHLRGFLVGYRACKKVPLLRLKGHSLIRVFA